MKTIFDTIDNNLKVDADEKIQPIYRISLDTGGVLLTTNNVVPMQDRNFITLPANNSIVIGFHKKDPHIVTTRKDVRMEMSLSLLIHTTFYPMQSIVKIEIMESKLDMEQLSEMLAGLRKTIIDQGTPKEA